MHYHPSYQQYLNKVEFYKEIGSDCPICYDGPIWEWDEEDYILYEQKEYRKRHPDRQWYKKFEKKRR